ncbi:hypothetical protein B9Z55_013685 [Caenorhabditis nigoni]|uniref:Uncharacterized protein n=1 Tax=Caenorhabditis nigoni TaxID=1611254 RepID=A0A2G5U2S3_9PELO|nr:hypothetical protein B9Z55_013685 [Caenorhabditis nigoni]
MPVTPAALMMSDTFMQTKRGDARTAGPTSRTSRTVSKAEIGTIRIMTTCAAEEKERFGMSLDRTYRVGIVISELFELSFFL